LFFCRKSSSCSRSLRSWKIVDTWLGRLSDGPCDGPFGLSASPLSFAFFVRMRDSWRDGDTGDRKPPDRFTTILIAPHELLRAIAGLRSYDRCVHSKRSFFGLIGLRGVTMFAMYMWDRVRGDCGFVLRRRSCEARHHRSLWNYLYTSFLHSAGDQRVLTQGWARPTRGDDHSSCVGARVGGKLLSPRS